MGGAPLAESAGVAIDFYRTRAELEEQLHAARQDWAARIAPTRLAAIQPDALLRRRDPYTPLEPLKLAQSEALPDELPEPSPDSNARHATLAAEPKVISPRHVASQIRWNARSNA